MITGPIEPLTRGARIRRGVAIVASLVGLLMLLTGLFGNFDHYHVEIARLHWTNEKTPETEAVWLRERDRAIEEESAIALSGVFILVVGLLMLRSPGNTRLPWNR